MPLADRARAWHSGGPQVTGQDNSGHILLVEADADARAALAARLSAMGHRVTEADDGLAGVERARTGRPDLVLMACALPRLAGTKAARRLRADPATNHLPVVMLAPRENPDAIAESLGAGAADCLVLPCSDEELGARVGTQLALRALALDLKEARARLARSEVETRQRTLCAARIQGTLLRESLPAVPGARFTARYLPYVAASGDYYDVFRLDERTLGLFIADASGRGVTAAMLTVFVKMALEGAAKRIDAATGAYSLTPPAELLGMLNARLLGMDLGNEFITAFYAHYDLGTRRMVYASGAHPPPVLVRGAGAARAEPLPVEGSLIGIFEDARFATHAIELAPGDRLFLYTDGLLEARNGKGELCGELPLLKAAHAARTEALEEAAERFVAAARAHAAGRSFDDDVSLVVMEVSGP